MSMSEHEVVLINLVVERVSPVAMMPFPMHRVLDCSSGEMKQ